MVHFAHCALDRLYFLAGRMDLFRVDRVGHEHIQKLRDEKQGALLFGCHLGSFEALRAISRQADLPVTIIADFHNAARMNAILDLFGDNRRTKFLDAGGSRITLGLQVNDIIARGELVAVLADRAGHGRSEEVDFLGARARFPVGPYILAAHADCPVYFTASFSTAPNRYEIVCEPLFERIELPRRRREETLRRCAQRFADRLAHHARRRPDNWFNFYPFWSTDG
jgi:predicted LPLAT superfamily acyltransferase